MNSTKDYVGGIEYSGTNLEAIYFAEGRLTPNGAAFFYEYTIKDHLGNTRITFRANGASLTTLQENHYYPFGLEMEGAWQAQVGTENAYQYNGKELNEDFGLNLYDYGARWYDAAVGRWWSVDPLAEQSRLMSTYGYVGNNPMIMVDPTGMASEAYSFMNSYSSEDMQQKRTEKSAPSNEKSGEPIFDAKTKTVTIHSNLIFYGDKASSELASQAAEDIQNAWNESGTEVGGYKVQFNIIGSYRPDLTQEEVENNTDIRNNYIKITKENSIGVSFMDEIGSNTGVWLVKDIKNEGSTTEAHEFGHGYGLVHSSQDQRGQGVPDIMGARGTFVDPKYQYDSKATAGAKGGTVNPETRVVKDSNVVDAISNIRFNSSGTSLWKIGNLTNKFH